MYEIQAYVSPSWFVTFELGWLRRSLSGHLLTYFNVRYERCSKSFRVAAFLFGCGFWFAVYDER